MRHQKKRHKLGRSTPHRKATLAALGTALIRHKRITTTVPKAKALRVFIEPLITRAKDDTSHNRRQVFRRLQDNDTVSELFTDVSAQVGDRPGGYTRVVKLGRRAGDGAAMAMIELVDYNDVQPEGTGRSTKRTRRGGGKGRRRSRSKGAEPKEAAAAAGAVQPDDQVDAADKDAGADVDEGPTVEQSAADAAAAEESVSEDTVENTGAGAAADEATQEAGVTEEIEAPQQDTPNDSDEAVDDPAAAAKKQDAESDEEPDDASSATEDSADEEKGTK